MISADIALALLMNRTALTYQNTAPVYMTYREQTHVVAPSLNRSQDINRSVAVRVSDDYAVMRDLPNGGERTGQAFPIIPYFDPFSTFQFSYFANLKRVDIKLDRGKPFYLNIPQSDPSVDVTVPYWSYYAPRYAPDSTEQRIHLLLDPTPRMPNNAFYPSDVIVDPQSQLPSHVEMRATGTDEVIALDYQMLDGHWIITHGSFSDTQHALMLTFKVVANITYDQFTFPLAPPDARLAAPGSATASPLPASASPTP